MAEPLGCGSCSMCCTLLQVADIGKPARMPCWWTSVHGGCARHAEKETAPELAACAQWKCLWLVSQEKEPDKRMPRHLRPDISHVVLGPQDRENDMLLYVQVDPAHPNSWKNSEIGDYMQDMVSRGVSLEVIVDERRFTIAPDGTPAVAA